MINSSVSSTQRRCLLPESQRDSSKWWDIFTNSHTIRPTLSSWMFSTVHTPSAKSHSNTKPLSFILLPPPRAICSPNFLKNKEPFARQSIITLLLKEESIICTIPNVKFKKRLMNTTKQETILPMTSLPSYTHSIFWLNNTSDWIQGITFRPWWYTSSTDRLNPRWEGLQINM